MANEIAIGKNKPWKPCKPNRMCRVIKPNNSFIKPIPSLRKSDHIFGKHSLAICLMLFATTCLAQGTSADYARAEMIKEKMDNNIYYNPKSFQWLVKENKCWYLNTTPKGKEFILIDADTKTKKAAFDQSKLAISLTAIEGETIAAYQLPFTDFSFTEGRKEIEFTWNEKTWRADLTSYKCIAIGKPSATLPPRNPDGANDLSADPVKSPDGKWLAFIRNYNVYIQPISEKSGAFALSYDGSEGDYYSSNIAWSPDSKKIATNKIRPNKPHLVYLIESSPEDQLQPKLHSRNYLKPGDALPQKIPSLFVISTKKQYEIDPSLLSSQYNVTNPVWRKDSRSFSFEYNQRGSQSYKIFEVDAVSGKPKVLVDEQTKTFINNRKKYRYDLNDGKQILWASERDGWNHLYLYDGQTGKVINQVTKGDWVVRNVIKVNEQTRTIIFEASGREAGQDPYLLQLYKINFDGTGLTALTTENANHSTYFSSDYSLFIDNYSRTDLPSVSVLRSAEDGKIIMELEKADAKELLNIGWKMPEVFNSKGRDGVTDIWGIIVRPSNFNSKKKYPIIEYIYAGPHSSFVPKSFVSDPQSGDYRAWTELHEMAELGFIVVEIDGMGTSNRSEAFHDVCWMNLKDAGFPDRILWINAAAKKYPYMDTSRVGIFGNSAGGQNSVGALLFHPEYYKVAVSSSRCHDNRMDKIGWNEQWMGYPVGPQYAESSNVTNADKLKGQLLLILGEMDENVPPESTLQLINAFIKSNKQFDFLMVPGMGHSLGGDYGEHKRRDFFVQHLLGIKPPVWQGQNEL